MVGVSAVIIPSGVPPGTVLAPVHIPPAGVTVTVADAVAGGEVVPLQVSEYVVVTAGETTTLPEVPVPTPLHEVAFVELHVSVEDEPATIDVGLAVRVAVGAGGGFPVTVTVVVAVAGGDVAPLHVSLYVVVVVGWTTVVPDTPETGPVQEVALVELSVRVEAPPDATLVGEAVMVAVGAGGGEPPAADQQYLLKPSAGSVLTTPPTPQYPPDGSAAEERTII